jgi:lysophospholipase L1-like esterase
MPLGDLGSSVFVAGFRGPHPMLDMYVPSSKMAKYTISGVTRNSAGVALAGCVVEVFETASGLLRAVTTSDGGGNYSVDITSSETGLTFFVNAYLKGGGAPDLAGTSVNTLIGGPTIAPRLWAYVGDSVTAGTGSTAPFGFPQLAIEHAGTRNVSLLSTTNGTGGLTMAQVANNIPAFIAAGAKGIVIQGGINDAVANGSAVGVFAASATTAIGYCTAAGIPCVMMTTTPTYAGTTGGINTSTVQGLIWQYVQWVQNNAPGLGATVADAYTAIVDTPGPTGQMQAQYSNTATGGLGDSEHPGPLGHYAIGVVVGAAQVAAMAGMSQVVNYATLNNMHPNALNAGSGSLPNSCAYANFGGTTSTTSIITDVSGFLPAGKWAQADTNNVSGSNSLNTFLYAMNGSDWTAGDVIAYGGYFQIEDTVGNYKSDLFNNLSYVNVGLFFDGAEISGISISGPSTGPSLQVFKIGSGGVLQMGLQYSLKTGTDIKIRIGNMYVYNLTRLGLLGIV